VVGLDMSLSSKMKFCVSGQARIRASNGRRRSIKLQA
jgi:hypothetical protein